MQQVALGKAVKNSSWISDDNKIDPDILPELPGYHVLVRPISIKEKTKGKLKIDRGAIKALINHKSLLPAGVIESFGNFERGDAVEIISNNDDKIGQGLSGYSSFDVQQIKGCKTNEIEKKLGHPGRVAMIHIDDLVLI